MKIVKYTSYLWKGNVRLLLFYTNGVWDEEKYTYAQAVKAYPRNEYKWVRLTKKDAKRKRP